MISTTSRIAALYGGRQADDHRCVDLRERQRRHLEAVASWAERIRTTLDPILEAHAGRVHFRPGSKGVAMVGLLPDRPQRGKSGLRDLHRVARDFDTLFAQHCRDVEQGRVTGEKALQSWLIAEAHMNARRLVSINAASKATSDPVELVFVTDEIPVPVDSGKIVCDILALRVDGGRSTPVLLELKDARMLTRLVKQVDDYAALMQDHVESFEKLYATVLGEPVKFDRPTEKWIVWPSAGHGVDPREAELAEQGIRVVAYREREAGGYEFGVGRGVS